MVNSNSTCKYCGSALPTDAKQCPICKLPVEGTAFTISPAGITGMPSLFGMPTIGADLILGNAPQPNPTVDWSRWGMDFTSLKVLQGKFYRPSLIYGLTDLEQPVSGAVISILAQPNQHYLLEVIHTERNSITFESLSPEDHNTEILAEVKGINTEENPCAYPAFTMNAQGLIYLADAFQNRVRVINPQSPRKISAFGANWLTAPLDLAVDNQDFLYIADSGNHRIVKCDSQGHHGMNFGCEAGERSFGSGQSDESGFLCQPHGIALDAQNNLFVADTHHHCIQKFAPNGECAFSFGYQGNLPSQFNYPTRIRLDGQGNIFVADCNGERLQKFDPSGVYVCHWNLPENSGGLADFCLSPTGQPVVVLPRHNLVLEMEP